MAGVKGLEPSASCVTGRRSNQLSYTPLGCVSFYQIFFDFASVFLSFLKLFYNSLILKNFFIFKIGLRRTIPRFKMNFV